MLIGIAGYKGSGKDTLGTLFCRQGYKRTTFAAPIKEGLVAALNFTEEQVYGTQAQKEAIDSRYGVSPRYAMQTLGTEWGRNTIHPNVWVNSCMSRIRQSGHRNWVVPDVRFANEANAIKKEGGRIIEIIRGSRGVDAHASETSASRFSSDVVILNNGSVESLVKLFLVEYDKIREHPGRLIYCTT